MKKGDLYPFSRTYGFLILIYASTTASRAIFSSAAPPTINFTTRINFFRCFFGLWLGCLCRCLVAASGSGIKYIPGHASKVAAGRCDLYAGTTGCRQAALENAVPID